MKIHQIAAQLYTVRDFLKTPAEIEKTLKKIRAIGYEAVQNQRARPDWGKRVGRPAEKRGPDLLRDT